MTTVIGLTTHKRVLHFLHLHTSHSACINLHFIYIMMWNSFYRVFADRSYKNGSQ